MAKYIVDLPKEYTSKSSLFGEILSIPIQINDGKNYNIPTAIKITPYTEFDRRTIEDEVWEFATTCTKMDGADSVDVFGGFLPDSFTRFSYQQAKARYEAWKKEKDEIRVGDEVIYPDDPDRAKAVVLRRCPPRLYKPIVDILCDDGVVLKQIAVENLARTGRHFDHIERMLEEMRNE